MELLALLQPSEDNSLSITLTRSLSLSLSVLEYLYVVIRLLVDWTPVCVLCAEQEVVSWSRKRAPEFRKEEVSESRNSEGSVCYHQDPGLIRTGSIDP